MPWERRGEERREHTRTTTFKHRPKSLNSPLASKYHPAISPTRHRVCQRSVSLCCLCCVCCLCIGLECAGREEVPHAREVLRVEAVFQDGNEGRDVVVCGEVVVVAVVRGGFGFQEEDWDWRLGLGFWHVRWLVGWSFWCWWWFEVGGDVF